MAFGYLVVALIAAGVAVFALQNGTPVAVQFLAWGTSTVPLAALVLASFALGVLLAGLPLLVSRWRYRSRAHTLEAQVRQLQTSLGDRDRALLASNRPRTPADPTPPRA